MKLRDLYEAAEEADTNEKSRKLYNEILALCPDEVDAKRELIALELHPSFQIYQLKQLVESLKKPKKIDWNIIETRPYMRCLIDMGMIYKMHLIRLRISCCLCICCIFYWLWSVVKAR